MIQLAVTFGRRLDAKSPDARSRPADVAKAETRPRRCADLQSYAGRTFVVKYGGHAMGDPELARDFAEDVVLLKAVGINPVVVTAGPADRRDVEKIGVESRFVDGMRVTDKATADIAEMVLSGAINKELVGWIAAAGGKGARHLGQGRGPGHSTQGDAHRQGPRQCDQRAVVSASSRAQAGSTRDRRYRLRRGMIPVIARSARARTATPTTSTPTRWRVRSRRARRGAAVPAHRRCGRARQGWRALTD